MRSDISRSKQNILFWRWNDNVLSMSLDDEINGIGPASADRLRQQGIETVEELAAADPENVSVPTGNMEELISRANQQTITSQSASDLLDEYQHDTDYVSTGVDILDDLLGGGWEDETIAMVYGQSGRGKSQLAFSSIVEAATEGSVAYIETEMQSKSVAQRLADIAEDPEVLDNITFYSAYSLSEQYDTYQTVVDDHDDLVALYVDSFTAQFRMTDDFDGRENLGARSNAIGKHLRQLGKLSRSHGFPIVMTGQVYPQPEAYGKSDQLWGGEKLRHFISYFVRMSNGKGELFEATLENHPGRSEGGVLVNITEEGVDGVQEAE